MEKILKKKTPDKSFKMKSETDNRINPQEIPPPTRNGRPLVDGEASEDPLDVAAARFNLTRQRAEEIFQFFDETMNSGDQMMRGSLSQAVAEAMCERDKQWIIWLGKIFSTLDVYTSQQRGRKFIRMSIVTVMYVLGYADEAGVKSFADIARKLNLARNQSGKQTVAKCAAHFLAQLKLAPMLTQRTEAARAEMRAARLDQLKPK